MKQIKVFKLLLFTILIIFMVGIYISSAMENDITDRSVTEDRIHWSEELSKGGNTMIALGLCSLATMAFALERLIRLRSGRIAPAGLANEVLPLYRQKKFVKILDLCDRYPGVLSEIIRFIVHHRHLDFKTLSNAAGDIAGREMRIQQQRIHPLAVIASLSPLLGLLGTIIGMIEAFKKVSIYGDIGGAAMLADSISKALITTAVGLIIAIPSLVLYHFFKQRLYRLVNQLEESVDLIITTWFLETIE